MNVVQSFDLGSRQNNKTKSLKLILSNRKRYCFWSAFHERDSRLSETHTGSETRIGTAQMHHSWMTFTDLSRGSVDMGSIPFLSLSICLLLTFRSLFSPSCCAFGGRARPKCPTQRYLFLSLLIPLFINPALFLPHMPLSGCGWLERWGRSLEIHLQESENKCFCTIPHHWPQVSIKS